MSWEPNHYQSGLGNHFETEAIEGALPRGQNSPKSVPHGLYAEQLSGSAFMAPRNENFRTWCYRIRPSVTHGAFSAIAASDWKSGPAAAASPEQWRWDPIGAPKGPADFLQGLKTVAVNGDCRAHVGCGVHVYSFNQPMKTQFLYSADGDLLFVPQEATLLLRTELGHLTVAPTEIAVIPRGIKFQVEADGPAKGYVCENYGAAFRLPELGPIGSNGLANPRDFLTPVARFEDRDGDFQLVARYQGQLWQAPIDHSPLDVVAWHGNFAPYKYDLKRFNVINTVSYDHPDPSIFTVLTSSADRPGVPNVDLVIFPPRWMVAEHTFRPPWFHRNVMSEFMGLIHGVYDAKAKGFLPGGYSIHNSFSAHGPDAETFEQAVAAPDKPAFIGDTMAFMFESSFAFVPTAWAITAPNRQSDYLGVWKNLKKRFAPGKKG